MPHLECIDLAKVYVVGGAALAALDGVSLALERGDFVSIVGHSGSGKTTLLSLMGGILQPSSGRVVIDGVDLATLDDDGLAACRSQKIGFMFQFASLLPMLTVRENVLLPTLFDPAGARAAQDEDRALACLDRLGLGSRLGAYPTQLSGGQQRRVAIARALTMRPEIILADEPTGDLDEQTEEEVMKLFEDVNREEKVTIVLITHNLALARRAPKVLRMTDGRLATA